MTHHETWTVPPGVAISDGSGGSQKPLVVAGTPTVGDTPVWNGTMWVPAVPGGAGLQFVTVPVSSAVLLALNDLAPKTLVAGQAGFVVQPYKIVFVLLAGVAYSWAGNNSWGLTLGYRSDQGDEGTYESLFGSGFFHDQLATATDWYATWQAQFNVDRALASFSGRDLVLSCEQGPPITGTGRLLVRVSYDLVPVTA